MTGSLSRLLLTGPGEVVREPQHFSTLLRHACQGTCRLVSGSAEYVCVEHERERAVVYFNLNTLPTVRFVFGRKDSQGAATLVADRDAAAVPAIAPCSDKIIGRG